MKIKPEIRDRILNAARELVAEGVGTPTNDQVREKMGKGSLAHISPVMREWKEQRKTEIAAALEMPAELKRVVETSLAQIWTAASKLANAGIEKLREDAQSKIDTAERELEEALSEVSRLETEIESLKSKSLECEQKGELAEKQLSKLTTENSALHARVDDRSIQVESLKSELKEARADNKALQKELIAIAKGKNRSKNS
ncbi:DNA-binding protein [uncultured Microbulbifer sp.]|uniref:DNA-binding protein n=1 Tax=uncultured Microbulbifer sp. TaxID=348147 RepID=UPI00262F7674|nr:DNA-binding protein [uncultured Microbulbifer sp.]